MDIIGLTFLLAFLPLSLLLYWGVIKKPGYKLWFLCALSYLFYALAGLQFVGLLLGLSVSTFFLAHFRRFNTPAIVLNLVALGFFKYWDFGVENLNAVSDMLGAPQVATILNLSLPLGISYFVFKHIGYLLDVRRNRYDTSRDLLAFVTFSAFFPQITAGPISSFDDTGSQLRALPREIDGDQFYRGLIFLGLGLAKKLLIADVLSHALQEGFYATSAEGSGMMWAWSSVLVFAFQLYFDFSGYTDLVLGVGLLFGVTLPPNFNNPYLATTPSQFWQRWHISVSNWFRFYLFSPLSRGLLRRYGSERAGPIQYSANLVTMLSIGLWHGASWGFLLWGGYHGLLLNFSAWTNRRRIQIIRNPFVAQIILFLAVLVGWALIVSPDLDVTLLLLKNMFGVMGPGSLQHITAAYDRQSLITLIVAISMTITGVVEAQNVPQIRNRAFAAAVGVLTVLSLLQMGQAVEFFYQQF